MSMEVQPRPVLHQGGPSSPSVDMVESRQSFGLIALFAPELSEVRYDSNLLEQTIDDDPADTIPGLRLYPSARMELQGLPADEYTGGTVNYNLPRKELRPASFLLVDRYQLLSVRTALGRLIGKSEVPSMGNSGLLVIEDLTQVISEQRGFRGRKVDTVVSTAVNPSSDVEEVAFCHVGTRRGNMHAMRATTLRVPRFKG